MITADTFTQYVMAVQRPEWHFEMDDDKDKAVATRKRILDMLAADKLFVRKLSYALSRHRLCGKGPGRLSLGAAQLSAQFIGRAYAA